MKEKKTVLSVIIGITIVSLFTAIVAGVADGLSVLIDGDDIYQLGAHYHYEIGIGVLELVTVAFGVAFLSVFLFAKGKNRRNGMIVLISVMSLYSVITLIIMKIIIPRFNDGVMYNTDYAMFSGYMSMLLTFVVSSVLACVSSILLDKLKEAENIKESESSEGKSDQE